jgi:diguanylate cyclase (GGDEF)-like protein
VGKLLKTLIVEDDRVSACYLRRLLEQQKHEVTLVENGQEAWQKLCTENYAIVVTGWLMPEMDGLELARRIRGRRDSGYTYIMLLSTRDRQQDMFAGIQAGADDFLTKPLKREELFSRLTVAERFLNLKTQLNHKTSELQRANEELERISHLNEKYMEDIRATCRQLERAVVLQKARAITDSLTGLKNHLEFQEQLEDEINRASRYHLPLSLIMLDVDHFKRFNDSYGHPAGDETLKKLAHILQIHARETDILARYGGEEFAVILANTDREHAIAAAERFRAAIIEEEWPFHPITVSMGISTLGIVPQTRADLVTEADTALYVSKSRGRDCISHHTQINEVA